MKKSSRSTIVADTVSNHRAQQENVAAYSGTNGKAHAPAIQLPSVLVGRIAAMRSGVALIDFPGNTLGELVPARSLVAISQAEIGREVALTFEDGEATRPIIVGILQSAASPTSDTKQEEETLLLTAKKEIVIRCGKASIVLTNAGKLLIQGEYILSRSSGVNKIRGGSIQLN